MSIATSIAIETHHQRPPEGWDDYVAAHAQASAYHASRWPLAVARLFGQQAHFITARHPDGRLAGVLPLVAQRSFIFGHRLTSLPYFNYGGALADSTAIHAALLDQAISLARKTGARHLEIREVESPPVDWPMRRDKAALLLDLPPSVEELNRALGAKLRSQVKRAQREQPAARTGGLELVPDFYRVFAEVMRDLGTPVYPRAFFETLFEQCGDQCRVLILELGGSPVAGALLVSHRGTLEIPWAATLSAVKSKSINMALYWEVLRHAIESGHARFDFGRSTVDSGPYRFKLQWGARPVPLHWATWTSSPEKAPAAGVDPDAGSRSRRLLTGTWSRLPLVVANRLGPLVSPSLPW